MSNETKRMKIPYPSRLEENYYGTFEAGQNAIDSALFADFEHRNHIFHGGEIIQWQFNAVSQAWELTWSEDIQVQSPSFGQYIRLPSSLGPAAIPPGYFLYVTLPLGPTEEVELGAWEQGSQIPVNNSSFTMAWHNPANNKLIFRTGLVIEPNSTVNNGVFPITEVTVVTGDAESLRGVPICPGAATPAVGEALLYDGSEWCNAPVSGGGGGADHRYVVGTDPSAQYNSIQDAIDDAHAEFLSSGIPGVVYIREGVYTEDLALPGGVDLVGAAPTTIPSNDVFLGLLEGPYRTVIVGTHTVTPLRLDFTAIIPYWEKWGTAFSNIRFSYQPAVPTTSDSVIEVLPLSPPAGASEIGYAQVWLNGCVRAEQAVSIGGNLTRGPTTRFIGGSPSTDTFAYVFVSDCLIYGGADTTLGSEDDGQLACMYLARGTFNIRNSVIASVTDQTSGFQEAIRPAITVGDAGRLKMIQSATRGAVWLEGGSGFEIIDIEDSTIVGTTGNAVGSPRAAMWLNADDLELNIRDCVIASQQGSDQGSPYAISGTIAIQFNGYIDGALYTAEDGIGGPFLRCGVDPGIIAPASRELTVAKSTFIEDPAAAGNVWTYFGLGPGDVHSGVPPVGGGMFIGGDSQEVIIDGKLSVTGLIDPTGLVLDAEDQSLVPTGPGKGAVFVSDGTAPASSAGNLYYKDPAGVVTDLTAAAGGGEVNTASNVGTAGVGPFKQKTGVNLEFNNIADSGLGKVVVGLDAGSSLVTLDVFEGALDVSTMLGTKAEIDSTAIHSNVANEISPIPAKLSPATADLLLIEDNAAAGAKKSMTLGDMFSTLGPDLTTAYQQDPDLQTSGPIGNLTVSGTEGFRVELDGDVEIEPGGEVIVAPVGGISLSVTAPTTPISLDATNGVRIGTNQRLEAANPLVVEDAVAAFQNVRARDPIVDDDLATKRYVDSKDTPLKTVVATVVPTDFVASSTTNLVLFQIPPTAAPWITKIQLHIIQPFDNGAILEASTTSVSLAVAGTNFPTNLVGPWYGGAGSSVWVIDGAELGFPVGGDAVTLDLAVPAAVPTVGKAYFMIQYIEDMP